MPFIQVNVTKKLSDEQKDAIKSGIGQAVSLIPGKTEKVLMVDISDQHTMYFGGEKKDDCAFVDFKMYGDTEFDSKKIFTEAVFDVIEAQTAIGKNDIFMTISAFDVWGLRGTLK